MFGERFGHVFDKPLRGLALHIPLSPNSLTVAGFAVTAGAALVLVSDLRLGGLLVLLGGVFDVFDGVVARVQGRESRFGAFLDSLLDRLSDSLILAGIGVHYHLQGHTDGALLSLACLVGAYMVSYARARAEGLGVDCKVGMMERPERIILLSSGALSGLLLPVLWILAVTTAFTVLQRIRRVREAADR